MPSSSWCTSCCRCSPRSGWIGGGLWIGARTFALAQTGCLGLEGPQERQQRLRGLAFDLPESQQDIKLFEDRRWCVLLAGDHDQRVDVLVHELMRRGASVGILGEHGLAGAREELTAVAAVLALTQVLFGDLIN